MTRRGFLRALTAASAAGLVAGCGEDDMDRVANQLISPEEEAEIGRQAFQQILAQTSVADEFRGHVTDLARPDGN